MINKQYEKTIAKLQTKVDLLEAELYYLNKMLVQVGFEGGINALKMAVEEVLLESDVHVHSPVVRKRVQGNS